MTKSSVLQKLPRPELMALHYQHPPRQDAKRALEHTHILVEYQRANAGTLQQRDHRRDQDCIVCTN
jgi:hypothetical protein